MTDLLFNLLSAKKKYDDSKEEYIDSVSMFFNNAIHDVSIIFKHNRLYLSFYCWEEIPPKMMLDFTNKFGYLAPTVKYHDATNITVRLIIREYTFIKILR